MRIEHYSINEEVSKTRLDGKIQDERKRLLYMSGY